VDAAVPDAAETVAAADGEKDSCSFDKLVARSGEAMGEAIGDVIVIGVATRDDDTGVAVGGAIGDEATCGISATWPRPPAAVVLDAKAAGGDGEGGGGAEPDAAMCVGENDIDPAPLLELLPLLRVVLALLLIRMPPRSFGHVDADAGADPEPDADAGFGGGGGARAAERTDEFSEPSVYDMRCRKSKGERNIEILRWGAWLRLGHDTTHDTLHRTSIAWLVKHANTFALSPNPSQPFPTPIDRHSTMQSMVIAKRASRRHCIIQPSRFDVHHETLWMPTGM